MFAELVWDCWSWTAWQFFQVKDSKGNYGENPGSREQYTGYFPLWQLSYDILRYFRRKIEREYMSFQMLFTAGPDEEMPWFTWTQFWNFVGNMTDEVVEEGGDIMNVADPRAEFERKVLSQGQIDAFAKRLSEQDREILRLRMEHHTEQQIATAVGFKTASAVHK